MEHDTISRYRVARLSMFPPRVDGANLRYAVTANRIVRGIPSGVIVVDGVLPGAPSHPTTDELLRLFDSAVRQHVLY